MAEAQGNAKVEAVHGLTGLIRETIDDDPRFAVLDAIGSAMGMTVVVGHADGARLVITVVPDMVDVLAQVQEHHAERMMRYDEPY
jgi:hypothetical protein